jgi:hypothetical protein
MRMTGNQTRQRESRLAARTMSASSEAEHVVALPPTYVAGFHNETAVRQMPYRSPHCHLHALCRAVPRGALNRGWCRELAGTGMTVSALGFGASALAVRPAGTIRASCPSLLFRRAPASVVPRVRLPIHITYYAQGVFHDVTQDECIQVVHQTLKAGRPWSRANFVRVRVWVPRVCARCVCARAQIITPGPASSGAAAVSLTQDT